MSAFKKGLQAAVPTAMGYASIGLACGILGAQSGITVAEMALMSLIMYTGSGQFAICAMVLAQTDLVTGTITVLLLQLRNLLLNLHATTVFKAQPFYKQLLIASLTTDESYGLMLSHELETGGVSAEWMFGNNLAGYTSWFVFTVLGTLVGGLVPAPERLGIDFALLAMFLAIFLGQFEALAKRLPFLRLGAMLMSVAVVYLVAVCFITSSLAVLVATLTGCFVGVMTDVS